MLYILITQDVSNPKSKIISGLYTRKVVGVRDSISIADSGNADIATLYGVKSENLNRYFDDVDGIIDHADIAFSTDENVQAVVNSKK